MLDPLQTVLMVGSLALAAAALVLIVLDRHVGTPLVVAAGVLELGLLVQCVVGIVQLTTTDRDVAGVTFVGYLVGMLLVLPAATAWSLGERSRSGTAVLLVGALVVPVLVLRVQQIWTAPGA